MFILALLVVLVVDALAIAAALALRRRTSSTFLKAMATGFVLTVVVGGAALVALTTTGVQTRIVMAALARKEPTATIIATDRTMRGRIDDAVRRGLDAPDGKVEGVRREVGAVLRPYMTYRLLNAPDRYVVDSARAMRDILTRARSEGAATCTAVLSGDVATVSRLAVPASSAWLPAMLRADALDRPPSADHQRVVDFVRGVAQRKGWTQADLAEAMQRRGRLVCDYPLATIDAALTLPPEQAAPLLRALGLGASVGLSG